MFVCWYACVCVRVRVRAEAGVDQTCPLSPLLFSLGLAEALREIAVRLQALDAGAKLFAYLDDVVVVVPATVRGEAAKVVEQVLKDYGLVVNDKTKAWTRNPNTPLPAALAARRVASLSLLGASVAWLDREAGELHAPLHAQSDGQDVLDRAQRLTQRLTLLRTAGLSAKATFLILQTFGQSCVNHLQRANYEDGQWVGHLEGVLFQGLESLVDHAASAQLRQLASLRLKDGGLAFGGIRRRSASAFLASWAFCFKEVAGVVGVSTLQGFRSRCPGVAGVLDVAETTLRTQGGNRGRALPWEDYLAEPAEKLQASFAAEISETLKESLLNGLGDEDAADLHSNGGTGAGGFLLPPAEGVMVLPDDHFTLALRDRLLLPICPEGACCKHTRRNDGRICGAPLDRRGKHARMCAIGGGVMARHNRIRDWIGPTYTQCSGLPASMEQRVPH